ncbi:MAG: hypothetical protein HFACDABA_01931 [Anaerolineales bacterium]|nr:hypothetical protein [Anaerolineales bacterium]
MRRRNMDPSVESKIRSDAFLRFLDATFEEIRPGYARVSLTVTESMLNFHGITQGGVVFALGDLAFSAASNSHGQVAVALDMTISFLRATTVGDHLVAQAEEVSLGNRTALYEITLRETTRNEIVARIQATAYRKKEKVG